MAFLIAVTLATIILLVVCAVFGRRPPAGYRSRLAEWDRKHRRTRQQILDEDAAAIRSDWDAVFGDIEHACRAVNPSPAPAVTEEPTKNEWFVPQHKIDEMIAKYGDGSTPDAQ
jgi:hypothetical protein